MGVSWEGESRLTDSAEPPMYLPQFLLVWAAIAMGHAMFVPAVMLVAARLGVDHPQLVVVEVGTISTLSSVLFAALQWLILLRRWKVSGAWIVVPFIVSGFVLVLVGFVQPRVPPGLADPRILVVATGVSVLLVQAAAQWACIPPRFELRWLWLVAAPGVGFIELAVRYFAPALIQNDGGGILQVVLRVAASAAAGAVLWWILLASRDEFSDESMRPLA